MHLVGVCPLCPCATETVAFGRTNIYGFLTTSRLLVLHHENGHESFVQKLIFVQCPLKWHYPQYLVNGKLCCSAACQASVLLMR